MSSPKILRGGWPLTLKSKLPPIKFIEMIPRKKQSPLIWISNRCIHWPMDCHTQRMGRMGIKYLLGICKYSNFFKNLNLLGMKIRCSSPPLISTTSRRKFGAMRSPALPTHQGPWMIRPLLSAIPHRLRREIRMVEKIRKDTVVACQSLTRYSMRALRKTKSPPPKDKARNTTTTQA